MTKILFKSIACFWLLILIIATFGQMIPMGGFSPSGASSVGPSGNIQLSNGTGGFLDSGCQINNGGFSVNCPTFTIANRQYSYSCAAGTCTCQLFPDQSYFNTAANTYPQDSWSNNYTQGTDYLANALLAITNATWSAGTATLTVASTANIVNGHSYNVNGVVSSGCVTGLDCGYNDQVSTLGGTGSLYAMTVVNGTTLTYPLTNNPGTYTSGGNISYNGSGNVWQSTFSSDQLINLFHFVPNMPINLANNTVATLTPTNSTWDVSGIESDTGPFPWTSSTLMEGFAYTIASGFNWVHVTDATGSQAGNDNHTFTVNFDTCALYETYQLQSSSAPWHNQIGVIWNLNSADLRTAHKVNWYGNDSYGLSSGDAAGLPIYPLVLTYAELFGSDPIHHAIRVGVPCQANGHYNGYKWPATHGLNASTIADGAPLGSRWLLNSTFDTTTCHFRDCAGLTWPSYFQKLLIALQQYGVIIADCGGPFISILGDYVSGWGATDDPAGLDYLMTGYMHGVRWSDGYIVDPTQHVVNVLSHATR